MTPHASVAANWRRRTVGVFSLSERFARGTAARRLGSVARIHDLGGDGHLVRTHNNQNEEQHGRKSKSARHGGWYMRSAESDGLAKVIGMIKCQHGVTAS